MLLLDTHVWVWWIGGTGCPALSEKVRRAIDETSSIGISAISCVEVAWLVANERLAFDRDPLLWIKQALARPRVTLLEISPEVAVLAANLQWEHKDPADRIITATALHHKADIATKDKQIRSFKGVKTIW